MTRIKNNSTLTQDEQAIVALCTPQGSGAIALIRVSGDNAVEVVDRMAALPTKKSLCDQKSHTIHFGYVIDEGGKHIDQVLFLLMKAPRTFTGQDVVEITCHNNQFLIESIVDRALACGARLAGNGEFSQRAVLNGKMDLVQAEGMNDLIHAQSAEALKYSLQQLEGSFSSWIADIEKSVIHMLALCEASFEFLDEEEMEFAVDIRKQLDQVVQKIKELLQTYSKQQYIKEGVRIALVGTVNAGKSSLFNCLVHKDRAIVTDIAGTTRDSIESGLYKNGIFLTFVDTAGIRKTDDIVEQQGIDRSFKEASGSDIVLLVVDSAEDMTEQQQVEYQKIIDQYQEKVIVVSNKIDKQEDVQHKLTIPSEVAHVLVSAKEKRNIDQLRAFIDQKIEVLKDVGTVSGLLNKRQYSLLATFLEHLQNTSGMLQDPVDYELVSYTLKKSLQLLSEVTGRAVSEEAMNQVFKTFCVGK